MHHSTSYLCNHDSRSEVRRDTVVERRFPFINLYPIHADVIIVRINHLMKSHRNIMFGLVEEHLTGEEI